MMMIINDTGDDYDDDDGWAHVIMKFADLQVQSLKTEQSTS